MAGASTAVMRDHAVEERASTPLELFFDLCFVVAVAFLATELHHGVTDGHALEALLTYALLFIPIWWAWMSYTWFATAFSHDDAVTRLLTFAQMAGILAVAAAIPQAAHGELVPFALAYAVMRLPLVALWLRSARADPAHRGFALTYALGSVLAQVLWVTGALAGGVPRLLLFATALLVELGTPMAAVRRSPGRVFHARHIAERYGLFTIIVLGETVLAVSIGLREALGAGSVDATVLLVVGCALVIAMALWWMYFDTLGADALVKNRPAAFAWGYGHYAIFGAVAAVGAGVRAEIDVLGGAHGGGDHGGGHAAGAALVAASVAVVLLTLAVLQRVTAPAPTWHLTVAVAALVAVVPAAPTLGVGTAMAIVAGVTVAALLRQLATTRDTADH